MRNARGTAVFLPLLLFLASASITADFWGSLRPGPRTGFKFGEDAGEVALEFFRFDSFSPPGLLFARPDKGNAASV